jgi:hypothetical protein
VNQFVSEMMNWRKIKGTNAKPRRTPSFSFFNTVVPATGQRVSWSDARDTDKNAGGANDSGDGQENDREDGAGGQKQIRQPFETGEFLAGTAPIEDGERGQNRADREGKKFRPTDLEPVEHGSGDGGEQDAEHAAQCRIANDTLQWRLNL